jgi:hypothetical protein
MNESGDVFDSERFIPLLERDAGYPAFAGTTFMRNRERDRVPSATREQTFQSAASFSDDGCSPSR